MSMRNNKLFSGSRTIRRAAQRAGLEMLENRRLLSSTISGSIFTDLNGNGIPEVGEAPAENFRVYIDQNTNGSYDDGEPNVFTDAAGAYILNAPAGGQTIRVDVEEGWRTTSPVGSQYLVLVLPDNNYLNFNFGVHQIVGKVRGNAYVHPDNVSPSSPAENFDVYVDIDHSGTITPGDVISVTNALGHWQFEDLVPGDYQIRISPGLDYVVTSPVSKVFNVTVEADQDENIGTFHLYPDDNETSIIYINTAPGATVFIDANGNGILDNDERSRVTDGNGLARFTALPPRHLCDRD